MIKKRKLKSQPKIKGITRIPKPSSLHPLVWNGIREIAYYEKRSVSWVIAEIVSDYFGVDAATGEIDRKRHIRKVK
jgi:hypothetical protein